MKTVFYTVLLDGGVTITFQHDARHSGPAVTQSMIGSAEEYWKVYLPGVVSIITAPKATVRGINWSHIARALGAVLVLPQRDTPEPPKPRADPVPQISFLDDL